MASPGRSRAPSAAAAALLLLLALGPRPAPAAPPPPAWRTVPIGGGGFVTGVMSHPVTPYRTYIRTDVGGAYRWDAAGGTWLPLLESVPRLQGRYYGVEAMGLHPTK
jgi:hypothetical protein